jgi:putative ABC transport system permease protein
MLPERKPRQTLDSRVAVKERSRTHMAQRSSGARSENPEQTITAVTTLEAVMGRAVAQPRTIAWLLGVCGTIGLTLRAIGIFGVLAYSVTQRRRETGVRLAFGVSPRAVLRVILGQGLLLAITGVAIGVAGAAILTRSMALRLAGGTALLGTAWAGLSTCSFCFFASAAPLERDAR